MGNYKPKDLSMWDTWCVEAGDTVHMYHLQFLEPDANIPCDFLGHAVSKDLINWQECYYPLGPNTDGTDDDMQPWTGCTIYYDNKFYMYYTMRSKKFSATRQKIGLAISDDGYKFTRYEGNPVIEPDIRWYNNDPSVCGCIDCRDLILVKYEDYWLGYYAARVHGDSPTATSTVACVKSYDLFHWEHLPPVFTPKKYACIEVPDVYYLNGRWYLTLLAGNSYGNRGIYSDSNIFSGTIYAVSDSPLGPFVELDNNVLIGGGITCGYSCRSIMFKGKRYVIYTQKSASGDNLNAVVSRPYLLDTDEMGHLLLKYPSDISEAKIGKEVDIDIDLRPMCSHPAWNFNEGTWSVAGNSCVGSADRGWQTAQILNGSKSMEIEADITLLDGYACGLTIRPNKDAMFGLYDLGILMDAKDSKIFFTSLHFFNYENARDFPVEYGRTYHFHIVKNEEHIDIFIDGVLYIQMSYRLPVDAPIGIGVLVDRGNAKIDITKLMLE